MKNRLKTPKIGLVRGLIFAVSLAFIILVLIQNLSGGLPVPGSSEGQTATDFPIEDPARVDADSSGTSSTIRLPEIPSLKELMGGIRNLVQNF